MKRYPFRSWTTGSKQPDRDTAAVSAGFKSYFLLASGLVLLCSFALYQWPSNFEDSFITYRYIAALTETGGFNWNFDHNPIYGMTGLIFPTISAAVNLLINDPALSESLVGTLFSLLAILFLAGKSSGSFLSCIVIFCLCINPIFLRGASYGLETSLAFLFICAIYLSPQLSKSWVAAGLSSLVAFYIRPDIILITYTHFSLKFVAERRWRELLIFNGWLALLLASALFVAYLCFGNALPLPSAVKLDGIGVLDYPQWVISQYIVFPTVASVGILIPIGFVMLRGLSRDPVETLALLAPIFIFIAYQMSTLPVMNVGLRFFAPILGGLVAVSLILDHKAPPVGSRFHWVLFSVSVIASVSVTPHYAAQAASRKSDALIFQSLATSLQGIDNLHIASSEAGKFAYFSIPSRFFDTIGLNNEFVVANFESENYPERLSEHFEEVGFPDVYARRMSGIGAGPYAYLEILPEFESRYDCREARGLKVCVLQASDERAEISARIEAWMTDAAEGSA